MSKMFLIDFFANLLKNVFVGKKKWAVAIVMILTGILGFITNANVIDAVCNSFHICLQDNRVLGLLIAALGYLIAVLNRASEMVQESTVKSLDTQISTLQAKLK